MQRSRDRQFPRRLLTLHRLRFFGERYHQVVVTSLQTISYRLERCPQCDYPLTGLPQSHACPECGCAYEAGMFQLYGWSLAGFGLSKRGVATGGGVLIVAAAISPLLGFGWSWFAALQLAFVAVVIVGSLYAIVALAESRGREHVVRYLITREGITVDGDRLLPWSSYAHMVLLQEGPDAWRIHINPGIWRAMQRVPVINVAFRGTFSEAEALSSELQRRMNEARDRQP